MGIEEADGAARRAYWAEKLDEAYTFMQRVRHHPVQECGEPLVSLAEAVQAAGVEVAFSSRPHVLGLPRLYFLRVGLIPAFLAAADAMLARGWVLKIEDAFRTREMQRQLMRQPYTFDILLDRVRWELEGQPLTAALLLRRLSALVANAPQVGTHLSGSAIDISVLDRATGREVDRGGLYIEISERTPMDSPYVSFEAQRNRAAITDLMAQHGFVTYPWEFWHYNAGDAYEAVLRGLDTPPRYGPVDLNQATGQVQPIADPLEELNSLDDIQGMLDLAVRRVETLGSERLGSP